MQKSKIKNQNLNGKTPQRGFIDLGLLVIGALIVTAVLIPLLSSQIVNKRVTTQERATTGDDARIGFNNAYLGPWTAGQTYTFYITAQNYGTTVWTEVNQYRVGWSYDNQTGNCSDFSPTSQCAWKIASTWKCDGTQTARPCDKREYLNEGESIPPSSYKQWNITVKAPLTPGTYPLRFRMLKEFVGYFGNDVVMNVSVDSATPTATLTPTTTPTGQSYPSCSTYGCSTLVGLTTTTSCPASYPYQTVICHGTYSGITQDWRCCNLAAPTPTPTHAPTCGGCSTLVDPTMACPVGYPKNDGICYVLPPVNQNLRCCNLMPTATPTPGYCFNIAGLPDCIGGTNAVVVSSACEACQADHPVRCKTNTSSGYVVACSTRPTTTLTPTPTPGYCPRGAEGNLNCSSDGIINLYDLMLMIDGHVWNKPPPTLPYPTLPALKYTPDISPAGGNGIVDVSDLSRLLNNWSR